MSSATAFCSSSIQSFASLATAACTVADAVPVSPPPDAPPPSVPPLAPPFTVLPTRLNWLRMAPETCGPANTTTRPMTAAINTYSMIDCPRRRVPLGDTPPPRRKCRCMHIAAPFAQGLQIRAKGRGGRRFLWQFCRSGKVSSHVLDRTPTGLHCFTPTELHAKHLAGI